MSQNLYTFRTLQNFRKAHFEIYISISLGKLLIYVCYRCTEVFIISFGIMNSIYEKVLNVRYSESMCQNINLSGILVNYNIPETCTFKYNDVLVSQLKNYLQFFKWEQSGVT